MYSIFYIPTFFYINKYLYFSIGKSTYLSFSRKSCYEKGPNTTNFYTPEKELENITLLPCSCERGTMSCPKGAEGPTPPKVKVNFSKTPKCIHL